MRIFHSIVIIGVIVFALSIGLEEAHLWRAPSFLLLFALFG